PRSPTTLWKTTWRKILPVTNTSTAESTTTHRPVMLHNGTVHSTAEPYAEAMLVKDGRVAWLGSDETAQRLAEEGTGDHDLDRGLAAPAFVGSVTVTVEQLQTGRLTEVLDTAANKFGYAALRLGISVS